jgi:hypothetical protein
MTIPLTKPQKEQYNLAVEQMHVLIGRRKKDASYQNEYKKFINQDIHFYHRQKTQRASSWWGVKEKTIIVRGRDGASVRRARDEAVEGHRSK